MPSAAQLLNSVRHRVRDGVPVLDASPVPFNVVRLESLTDQIPAAATPVQTVFMARFSDVPTNQFLNAKAVPGTLTAYVDDSPVPTAPSVDVNVNGNFTLPVPPVHTLRVSYAWQYFADGDILESLDEARRWLREFSDVTLVPDGLVGALVSYAAFDALQALSTAANFPDSKMGDGTVNWSQLAKGWQVSAQAQYTRACKEREEYYTQGPEALDPTAGGFSAPNLGGPYTPER